jgi:hypothetical protein
MTPPKRPPPPRRPRPRARPLLTLRPAGGDGQGINAMVSRWLLVILGLVVTGGVVILLLGNSDAAPATPKQLAERDVAQRLADAPLPPGARRVEGLPKSLDLDGPGQEPATPNLVDRGAEYVGPLSAAKALAWFEAHPPAGSGRSGGGSTGEAGKGTVVREVEDSWPDRPAVRERKLLVAVAARPGGGSAFRLDAQAVWVTPHPTAAKVPAAARLLELEYAHHGEPPREATVTKAAEVAAFAHLIDAAEASQPGTVSCPMIPADAPKLTLTFRAGRGGPALAAARQDLPGGCGQPLTLTVEGGKPSNLRASEPLVRRSLNRLGIKAGAAG